MRTQTRQRRSASAVSATSTGPAPTPPMPPYSDRATKARAIAQRFADALSGSVLDVGCDKAPLRTLIPQPEAYVGVDIAPDSADVALNLDEPAPLPFEDASFDAVVCTDVLEHLERCHAVFDELCRLSRRWVIVSLPNPLRTIVDALLHGEFSGWKHYGLPTRPPADRHRWFFSAEDAEAFIRAGAVRNAFHVRELFFEPCGAYEWRDATGVNRLDHPSVRRGPLWTLLDRGSGADSTRRAGKTCT